MAHPNRRPNPRPTVARGVALLIGLLVFAALIFAVAGWALYARDPVRLLDVVDRIAGGTQGAQEVARIRLGEGDSQLLRVFRAPQTPDARAPMVLFVHGGSWDSGHPASYTFVARGLAREGYLVALAGYRLGETGRYPGMLEDTAAAIATLRDRATRLGGDPDRIFVMGHSAGAYNVVQTVLDPRWLAQAKVPQEAIAGIVGLAGPYDFYPFDGPATRAAFGAFPDGAATQPINHVRGDAPPMLLATGTADTTVKPRNTEALAAALREAGGAVETRFYSGLSHSDAVVRLAAPWRKRHPQLFRDVLDFLRDPARVAGGDPQPSVPVQGETG